MTPEQRRVPCPCTLTQQDETCPVGYPSMLCEDCGGKGTVRLHGKVHERMLDALAASQPAVSNETLAARIAMDEAAGAIDALQARVTELEAGLRPYAEVAKYDIGDDEADADTFYPMQRYNRARHVTVGDLRRSRALLERKP